MKEDLERADKYEKLLIRNIYEANPEFQQGKKLLDVRDNPKYQEEDVDFIADGLKIEAKIDFTNLPNFFFEIVSNSKYGTLGCIYKTKSDELWYYFVRTKELYRFKTKELQEYIREQEISTPDRVKSGGDYAEGVVIPKPEVAKNLSYKSDYRIGINNGCL